MLTYLYFIIGLLCLYVTKSPKWYINELFPFKKLNFTQVPIILHKRCLWCLWQTSRPNSPRYYTYCYLSGCLLSCHILLQSVTPTLLCIASAAWLASYLPQNKASFCYSHHTIWHCYRYTETFSEVERTQAIESKGRCATSCVVQQLYYILLQPNYSYETFCNIQTTVCTSHTALCQEVSMRH